MPSKNSVRNFTEGGYYHVYNRGVEKRIIYNNEKDYSVFLSLLKGMLEPEEGYPDFSQDVELVTYCLMPNHFHLLIKQLRPNGITNFMKSLSTRYAMYFNARNKRVGSLFQDSYKAAPIRTDAQLMHLSRYIHLNSHKLRRRFTAYPYSGYRYYSGKANAEWIKPSSVLQLFDSPKEYGKFMLSSANSRSELGRVAID